MTKTTIDTVRNLANLAASNMRAKRKSEKEGNDWGVGHYDDKAFAYALSAKHVYNMAKIDVDN